VSKDEHMKRPAIVMLGFLLLSMAAPSVLADSLVLRSSQRSIKPGTVVKSGESLKVGKGHDVLILLATGDTQSLAGPVHYKEPIPPPANSTILNAYIAMFKARQDSIRLGAVRNAGQESCADRAEQNWKGIAELWAIGCHRHALESLDQILVEK
jgi:hypothetical protein